MGRVAQLSHTDKITIRTLVSEGHSYLAVAKRLDCAPSTVSILLRRDRMEVEQQARYEAFLAQERRAIELAELAGPAGPAPIDVQGFAHEYESEEDAWVRRRMAANAVQREQAQRARRANEAAAYQARRQAMMF